MIFGCKPHMRRMDGLPVTMVMIPGAALETKEEWPRPSAAGNEARHLGKRAVTLPAEQHLVLQYDDLMGGTLPLTEQSGARPGLDD